MLNIISGWIIEAGKQAMENQNNTRLETSRTPMSEEPIAYINLDEQRLEFAAPFEYKRSAFKQGKIPLYTTTHALNERISKKPLNEKAIKDIYWKVSNGNFRYPCAFIDGFQAAEKYHGIIENNED